MIRPLVISTTLSLFAGCAATSDPGPLIPNQPLVIRAGKPVADFPGENHFRNVRQLTFGGENAEAYWSGDGTKLILQSRLGAYKEGKFECDQIFVLDLVSGERKLVSTGKGRTTCSYFLQGDERIIYASTHKKSDQCPPPVMRVRGKYVWPIYESFDIFTANADGSGIKQVTSTPGYDAEATVCPMTGTIVFTSVRDGDLELYSMEPDGSNVKRLTNRPGYDGGAFYSHDGTKIVQRSGFLKTDKDRAEYYGYLKQHLVQPTVMEITVMDRDGKNFRQITNNGKANFAPFWHPDDKRIVFASNMDAPPGRAGATAFDIYMMNEDGTNLSRVTKNPSFDSFPMFSPDGKHIVFASNRYNPKGHERDTNIFVAEWVE